MIWSAGFVQCVLLSFRFPACFSGCDRATRSHRPDAHARPGHPRNEVSVRGLLKDPEFRIGVAQAMPLMPGMAAWGVMTGVAMIKSGLSLWEAVLMGTLVFAGSSQLAGLPLILGGAPMWVVLATSFCVNLRFVVFSAHLRPYFMHQKLGRRLFNGYFGADLIYVMFTNRFPVPATDDAGREAQQAYWAGNAMVNWVGWTGSGLLGIALANAIPMAWGLGFAAILSLIGVMCSLINSPLRVVSAGVAGAAAVAAFALPFRLNILVGIAAAVAVCLMLEKTGPFGPAGPAAPAPAEPIPPEGKGDPT
ncbi:MAG: branched-chain amino acid ABC transporter permease [Comamonadaceae bacterium]|nr:MAG: branched-chain amino acid ABC transporter permease [Comamonadaceae bacterium]